MALADPARDPGPVQRRFTATLVALGVVVLAVGLFLESTAPEPGNGGGAAPTAAARDATVPRQPPPSEALVPGEEREPAETTTTTATTTTSTPPSTGSTPVAPPRAVAAPAARTLAVSAGAAQRPDGSAARPFPTIAQAVEAAQPGDTVSVGPGTYPGFVTARPGRKDSPIRIVGSAAVIRGTGSGHLVELQHSHVTLEGFELARADILVWIFHSTGVRVVNNVLRESRGECIRIKYQSTDNEVAGNRFDGCGGNFNGGGSKTGEGVYIGTSPEQLKRNPTSEPDRSDRNWIHDNVMRTPAECVDIKEGSSANLVEGNICTDGRDSEAAGFSARGNSNVFRGNTSSGHRGAGIRLGGDNDGDGIDNVVIGNRLVDNRGYGVKVRRNPQRRICGNEVSGNGRGATDGGMDPRKPC